MMWDIEKAVGDNLDVTSVTSKLSSAWGTLVPIFGDMPQQQAEVDAYFPFITVGLVTASAYNDKDTIGTSALMQVDVWTRARGFKTCKEIGQACIDALARQSLAVPGHVTTELESEDYTRDPDGKTKHGILQFRVLILE